MASAHGLTTADCCALPYAPWRSPPHRRRARAAAVMDAHWTALHAMQCTLVILLDIFLQPVERWREKQEAV